MSNYQKKHAKYSSELNNGTIASVLLPLEYVL